MLNKIVLIACLLMIVFGCAKRKSTSSLITESKQVFFPVQTGYVNDFEEILTKEEETILAATLIGYEVATSNEIVIVTTSDIVPYDSIFDYTLDLANYWGVGKGELNNGVLITVSKSLRKIHIQNGKGIESLFTNEETNAVIDSLMIPEFKNDNYFQGLWNGVQGIKKELK